MMSIAVWLKTGIALFLVFLLPGVRIEKDKVFTQVEIQNLLTAEMTTLLAHGVTIEYQLYSSLKCEGTGGKKLLIQRVGRQIAYDYLENTYTLHEEDRLLYAGDNLGKLLLAAKKYALVWAVDTEMYTAYSLFAQLTLTEQPLMQPVPGITGADLWAGYKPAVEYEFMSKSK